VQLLIRAAWCSCRCIWPLWMWLPLQSWLRVVESARCCQRLSLPPAVALNHCFDCWTGATAHSLITAKVWTCRVCLLSCYLSACSGIGVYCLVLQQDMVVQCCTSYVCQCSGCNFLFLRHCFTECVLHLCICQSVCMCQSHGFGASHMVRHCVPP
jgi:hypothetical protein